ncbi:MAG TPA: GNAT family N-acetyltransferase [Methanomassiliicoccales archaeon]|jgi:ribosomal protein S18 acetylase RimI-like enzyme
MIRFRAMNRSDIPSLVKMSRENMASIIRSAWGMEWRDEPLLEWLMSKDVDTEVAMVDEELAGYVSLETVDRYMFVTSIQLWKDMQHRGFGTEIMKHVESKALGAGYEGVELVVQMTNDEALRFYRHLGYRKVCRKGNNYLMRKTLIGPGKG